MDDISELADVLYRERLARAREMSIAEKLAGGGELFVQACERMKWGIKAQFPHFTDEEVSIELDRRLHLLRRLEALGGPA